MAYFPFAGRKDSFFGDLHGQGRDAIDFFTDKKVVINRWILDPAPGEHLELGGQAVDPTGAAGMNASGTGAAARARSRPRRS